MSYKREWIQWIAATYPTEIPISVICSAPNCEKKPEFVFKGNVDYFLCLDCTELLRFEKRYAAYEGREKK